jgi:hypothetical protein
VAKRDQAFPDPAQFQSVKDFTYAALASSALKKAVVEILQQVEGELDAYDKLTKKKDDKVVNKFSIGG